MWSRERRAHSLPFPACCVEEDTAAESERKGDSVFLGELGTWVQVGTR